MTPLMEDQPSGADDRGRGSSVKAGMTPNRRPRAVENDEFASFVRRVIRAYARRVASGDVDALADITGMAPTWTRRSRRPSPGSGRPGTHGP